MVHVRYEKENREYREKAQKNLTPRPQSPKAPSGTFTQLGESSFSHPTYGMLLPCLVPETVSPTTYPQCECVDLLASQAVRRILENSDLSIPTLIVPWDRTFATHLRLTHFSENLFNVSVIWSNADVRQEEGFESGGDVLYGLDNHYELEWVHGEEEGLAFKDGFWGKEGLDSRSPGGQGKDSAEVWFEKV